MFLEVPRRRLWMVFSKLVFCCIMDASIPQACKTNVSVVRTQSMFLHILAFLIQVDDIERPLVSGESPNNESISSNSIEQAGRQTHGGFSSTHSIAKPPKQRLLSAPSQLTHSNKCTVFFCSSYVWL